MWRGETCVILAGGWSLSDDQIDLVRDCGLRTIVVNNSFLRAPWADVLYFCDSRWFGLHGKTPEFRAFKGLKTTLCKKSAGIDFELKWLENKTAEGDGSGIWPHPDGLATGRNGGYQAINLAFHFAVKRIILLGYDQRRGPDGEYQWHNDHPWENRPHVYTTIMLPGFPMLVAPAADRGIEIVNCSPGSALNVFPKMDLEAALAQCVLNV